MFLELKFKWKTHPKFLPNRWKVSRISKAAPMIKIVIDTSWFQQEMFWPGVRRISNAKSYLGHIDNLKRVEFLDNNVFYIIANK